MNATANHLAVMPGARTAKDVETELNRHSLGYDVPGPQQQSDRELLSIMLTAESTSLAFQAAMDETFRRHRDKIEQRRKEVEAHDSWLRAVYSFLFSPVC